jgi:preprotein translocase subunit SecD
LYVALSLVVFKLIHITLTAAGIAGFILSIGMAVDANILIFERMKEELKRGKKLTDAIHEGFHRAWL